MKIGFKDGRQNIVASHEITELEGLIWKDAPVGFDSSISFALLDGDVITVEPLSNEVDRLNSKKLRVHRVLNDWSDPLTSDFTILGFEKESPSYDRGRKTKAQYKDIATGEIVVEKIFSDVFHETEDRVKALSVTFNFYSEDGSIGSTKTEEVKKYNKFESETLERGRRYRQFDYLRASVKGTAHEPYIAIITEYFKNSIEAYKDNGILTLNSEMINTLTIDLSTLPSEQQQIVGTVQQILNADFPRNDGEGISTVIKFIQYQIGTITIEGL